jgi:tRNA threonylcarbamoyladenosine modification (KEOPS) complex  Pcc1 subunit
MKAKATIRLMFASNKQLSALINALTPEVHKQISTRSKVGLSCDGQMLVLDVEANDKVALRAALNSYLRWINSTITALEPVDKAL